MIVSVLWQFLTVLWVGLQCVMCFFTDPTQLCFVLQHMENLLIPSPLQPVEFHPVSAIFGPRRDITWLRGSRQSDIQISLLSYRDKLEH